MGIILKQLGEATHLSFLSLLFFLLVLPFIDAVDLDISEVRITANFTLNAGDYHFNHFIDENVSSAIYADSGTGFSGNAGGASMFYNFTNQSNNGFTITYINLTNVYDATGAVRGFSLSADCLNANNGFIANIFRILFNGNTILEGKFPINVTHSGCRLIKIVIENFTDVANRQIWANGIEFSGIEDTPAGGTQPSLSLYSDLKNGTITNVTVFNFYFNGTSVNNSNVYNCGLFADGVSKATGTNLDLTTSKNLSFTLPDKEAYVNFTLNCYNENASSNLSALYYVDNVPSVLNWAYPNGTYYNDEALYTNFSISDPNLYFFEWLVYQGATLKENITHQGITVDTYDVYNLSAVSQVTGTFTWQLNVWENHNPLSDVTLFEEYDAVTSENEIVYSLDDKAYVISSLELTTVKTTTDAYKQYFEFIPDKTVDTTEFHYFLEYHGTLEYLPDSEYQGHFVLWDIKRYVDFVCDDYVEVNKLSDSLYEIVTPCTKFETTGNLNFMQWTGNFTITTPPSLSDTYLLAIDGHIVEYGTAIITLLNQIYGGISMLGFIILWLGLWIIGYHAILTYNELLAGTMIILTLPIDLYFSYALRETLMLGTGFMGIAFGFMFGWTIGVFLLLKRPVKHG